jgi:hypothetical protein
VDKALADEAAGAIFAARERRLPVLEGGDMVDAVVVQNRLDNPAV